MSRIFFITMLLAIGGHAQAIPRGVCQIFGTKPLGTFRCSAVLIGNRLLTAAHCADGKIKRVYCSGIGDIEIADDRVEIHPAIDLAYYVLNKAHGSDFDAVASEEEYRRLVDKGTDRFYFGYGLDKESKNLAREVELGRFLEKTNVLDFSHEINSMVKGDSGGPFVIADGNRFKVVGITSGVHQFPSFFGGGTQRTTFANVASSYEWLSNPNFYEQLTPITVQQRVVALMKPYDKEQAPSSEQILRLYNGYQELAIRLVLTGGGDIKKAFDSIPIINNRYQVGTLRIAEQYRLGNLHDVIRLSEGIREASQQERMVQLTEDLAFKRIQQGAGSWSRLFMERLVQVTHAKPKDLACILTDTINHY